MTYESSLLRLTPPWHKLVWFTLAGRFPSHLCESQFAENANGRGVDEAFPGTIIIVDTQWVI